jgi:monofunctional glycosyltransferase
VRLIVRTLRRIAFWCFALALAFHAAALCGLVALRWMDPAVTTVQLQRCLEARLTHRPYHRHATFVPLGRISPALQHAVVAAEDGRFYQHHGIDWKEVQKVVDSTIDDGQLGRGASTITQQLVKNLFMTTHRSIARKALEFTLAPLAEKILTKHRILELYLNVIEWGPGVYGAEAAAHTWYGVPAAAVGREQAARLAAIIPAPRRRKPQRMNEYSANILHRMAQTGW